MIITGDIHADFTQFNTFINKKKPETIICCGDFGYWPIYNDNKYKNDVDLLKPQNTKIYWCDGNHEQHDLLDELVVKNGRQPIEVAENVFYVPRGCILTFNGKNFLFMGGADSIDKQYRKIKIDWFPQENGDPPPLPEDDRSYYNRYIQKSRVLRYANRIQKASYHPAGDAGQARRKYPPMFHRFPASPQAGYNRGEPMLSSYPCPVLSGSCNEARDRHHSTLWRKRYLRQVRMSGWESGFLLSFSEHIPKGVDSISRYSGRSRFCPCIAARIRYTEVSYTLQHQSTPLLFSGGFLHRRRVLHIPGKNVLYNRTGLTGTFYCAAHGQNWSSETDLKRDTHQYTRIAQDLIAVLSENRFHMVSRRTGVSAEIQERRFSWIIPNHG